MQYEKVNEIQVKFINGLSNSLAPKMAKQKIVILYKYKVCVLNLRK